MDLLLSNRHIAFDGMAVEWYIQTPYVVPGKGSACIPVFGHQSRCSESGMRHHCMRTPLYAI